MNKVLKVKEFESITGNEKYKDDDRFKYLEEPAFSELLNIIDSFAVDEDNVEGLKFMSSTIKPHIGRVVTAKNYVGVIQMKNGMQVQVLPKIYLNNEDESSDDKTNRIFIKMLRSMKDFPVKFLMMLVLKSIG